jgi:lipopolysaccharide export LptBFGC system permease protein LptF
MYTNIMSSANLAAANTASAAITKLYSDNFSDAFNDTNNKLLEWLALATDVQTIELSSSGSNNEVTSVPDLSEAEQIAQNVNVRKTFYENQSIQYLFNWNKLLHYLYYFFAVCLVIALFLSPNSFSIFTQVVVAVAVLSYPYYSTYLVKHIMKFYSDIKTLLPKNVYTHYSDNHNYFSPVSAPL